MPFARVGNIITDLKGIFMNSQRMMVLISVILFTVSMAAFYADSVVDARARGGGRSFGSSRSFSGSRPAIRPYTANPSRRVGAPGGSSFLRGLGGGLLGGFLGSLLFGSLVHAGGGIGGSGIGLFQLLIIGGIGYFFYKKFFSRPGNSARSPGIGPGDGYGGQSGYSTPPPPPGGTVGTIDAPPPGGFSSHSAFNQEEIKELAQDIFFKVQAAWMRRDLDAVRDLLGPELLAQYQQEFQDMKARGIVNRLENIAVRNVEIVDHGRESGFEYVKIRFNANLLDYSVEEASGRVIDGSNREPVKFQEVWTLARPEGTAEWKLYGVEEIS